MDKKLPKNISLFLNYNKDSKFKSYQNSTSNYINQSSHNSYVSRENYSNLSTNIRNRWGPKKNLGESIELNGTLSKKRIDQFENSTKGNWEILLNKSCEEVRIKKRSQKKNIEESITSRTLPSSLNNSFDCDFGREHKIKTHYPEIKKSTAVGSISEFIFNIPTIEPKTKRFCNKNIHLHTKIFSRDFRIVPKEEKRLKTPVDLNQIRSDNYIAGKPSNYRNSSLHINQTYDINRLTNTSYCNLYSHTSNIPNRLANKVGTKENTSRIFSTNCEYTKNKSKKTYYNNDNYKKFFTKNFVNF